MRLDVSDAFRNCLREHWWSDEGGIGGYRWGRGHPPPIAGNIFKIEVKLRGSMAQHPHPKYATAGCTFSFVKFTLSGKRKSHHLKEILLKSLSFTETTQRVFMSCLINELIHKFQSLHSAKRWVLSMSSSCLTAHPFVRSKNSFQ